MGHAILNSKHEKSLYQLSLSIGNKALPKEMSHEFLEELSYCTDAAQATVYLDVSAYTSKQIKERTYSWPISDRPIQIDIHTIQNLTKSSECLTALSLKPPHPLFALLDNNSKKTSIIYLWKLSTLGFLSLSLDRAAPLMECMLKELDKIMRSYATVLGLSLKANESNSISGRQKLLEDIVKTYPQPIIAIDKDHNVTVWNKACEKVFGILAKDVVGTNKQWKTFYPEPRPILADIVLSNNIEQLDQYYPNIYRKSPFIMGAYEAENFFPKIGDNEYNRWLYFTASRLHSDTGEAIGAVESLIDITSRMEAESEVRALNTALKQRTSDLEATNTELNNTMLKLANSEKLSSLGKLVAGIAHELNTPIGNIRTVTTSLLDETESLMLLLSQGKITKSALYDFLDMTLSSTQLIEHAIAKTAAVILNCKKASINRNEATRRQFYLANTMGELLHLRSKHLKQSNASITTDIPTSIKLDSFPSPLSQVLNNLIDNSLMHGFENLSSGEIMLSAFVDGSSVKITYTDNGCGIPSSVVEKAFDPFFSAHLEHVGSGLGLYIIYNLVTGVLSGSVELTSVEGEGTTITITLPLIAPYPVHPHQDDFHI